MKKVLIISSNFAPNNKIGALRPTKIAKYLIQKGYIVDVVSLGYGENDTQPIPEGINEWYHMQDETYTSIANKQVFSSLITKKPPFHNLRVLKRLYLLKKKEDKFVKYFKTIYFEHLSKNAYDVIFSSYGPMESLRCGIYFKKMQPQVKWICDFRDPAVVQITPKLRRCSNKRFQNKACKKADYITAVSNGYLHRICGEKYKEKSIMLPNGYDTNDFMLPTQSILDINYCHLTYVGALYGGKRKLTPLFRVLAQLNEENRINLSKIKFNYAGKDFAFVYEQAKNEGVENILVDYGLLPRKECLELQFSSTILILSTWNFRGEEGVFPGKFLEYMLIGKPIISLTDGNLSNSEVSSVIKEGNFGIAYESVNDAIDFIKLKEYIYKLYVEFEQYRSIDFQPIDSVLQRYNYDNIIEQLEQLF